MKKALFMLLAGIFLLAGSHARAEVTAADVLKEVKINGFASAGYNNNFNSPDSQAINYRPFNNKDNSFALEVMELVFQKEASGTGSVGFRADLNYGFTVPSAIRSTGLTAESDQFDLQQAYVTWVAPVGSGLTLDLGKFITELGAEVIDGYDGWNYNYSRSLLFYYTIPFTHTGLRASYAMSDNVQLIGGIVNGYDNVVDNNDAKSVFVHAAVTLSDGSLLNLKYIGGAEQDNSNGNLRHVYNVNYTREFMDKYTLNLDLVYGTEENEVTTGADATWQGVSGIIRYAVSDTFAWNVRAEIFKDDDGARTGTAQEMWEITVTPEFTVGQNMVIRPEYRHDASDVNAFDDGATATSSKTQDTVGVNVLFYF